MRFSLLAASFLVSAVLADETSTSYLTEIITTTHCAATVTNCPARSTVVSTTSYPVISSSPIVYYNSSAPAAPAAPTSAYVPPPPAPSAAGELPSSPVLLSTITISTCVPTVIYSTVTVAPSPPSTPAGPVASATGVISIPHNVTAPTIPAAAPSTIEASGATNVQGSIIVAAVAGLAAFLFA